MATIDVSTLVTVTDTNSDVSKHTASKSFTVTEIINREVAYAATTLQVLWEAGAPTADIADFDFCYLITTSDCDVSFRVYDGGSEEFEYTVRLLAGTPFILGADDSWTHTDQKLPFSGTARLIDRIQVRSPSGSGTIKLILGT